jgi:hypothetical protein
MFRIVKFLKYLSMFNVNVGAGDETVSRYGSGSTTIMRLLAASAPAILLLATRLKMQGVDSFF